MPKITVVKYGRTFNLGAYESERVDVEGEVDVEGGETPGEALERLRKFVEYNNTRAMYERQLAEQQAASDMPF